MSNEFISSADIAETLTLLGVGYPAAALASEAIERRRNAELDSDELDELHARVDELEEEVSDRDIRIMELARERDKARDRAGKLLAENRRLMSETEAD